MRTSIRLLGRVTRLTREPFIDVAQRGHELLNNPRLNKGSAFSQEERRIFGMRGLLPTRVNTLEDQVQRAYIQFCTLPTDLLRNSFCESLKSQNEVLYYALIKAHLKEMMRIIYTPTQGDAIAKYSELFRRPQGCFLDVHLPNDIEKRLAHFGDNEDIDYIVVTDSESILGIGDQGVGGIGISVAKLGLMTVCGGIHPSRGIPVVVDCGTNNKQLLNDPLYMGHKHPRVEGPEYDEFMDSLIAAIKHRFPNAVVHFEDFGTRNAYKLLKKYKREVPCFNDDIQGTGAVTLSALKGALHSTHQHLKDAKIVIYGAGSAGMGIAHQILSNLTTQGLSKEEARRNLYMMDRFGLVCDSTLKEASPEQAEFAHSGWAGKDHKSLLEVVKTVQPDVLIGCSTQAGAFTEEIVKEMASHVERPVILPLSNPTRLHEATPKNLLEWTDGRALVATGSPFADVNGRKISENNNCFIFPGVGLGAVLSRASYISKGMIAAATDSLASLSPVLHDANGPLLPDIKDIHEISAHVATAVVLQAKAEGLDRVSKEISIEEDEHVEIPTDYDEAFVWVCSQMWKPEYRRYRRSH